MQNWNLATISDLLRTAIILVGGIVAFVQLQENYRLRRVQALSSLNHRLSECRAACKFLLDGELSWKLADAETQIDIVNYIATFEDIAISRKQGIISKKDFILSYGGRFEKLMKSNLVSSVIDSGGYHRDNFQLLKFLCDDIGIAPP